LKVVTKVYCGNLPYSMVDGSELEKLAAEFGTVRSVQVIVDRESGLGKGFGFVEMSNEDEAQAAIDGMEGRVLGGRGLRCSPARPRESRGGRGARKS